ncbi:MAG TPA: hypothetical protein VKG85_10560 [Actinomycetes bacterium]|nr:hypothetical protein [Actinomycetes bacterium]
MASITGWTRLEPRPRSRDFARALEARVHDPLWLLVRQWQVGEFKGDDAGSLTAARLEIDTTPVNRYQPGANGTARPYDLRRLPLEALVERERVRAAVSNGDEPAPGASNTSTDFDLRLAAEAGLQFLRLLRDAGIETDYRSDYLQTYPLAADATTTLDAASHRFVSVVAGRAPDGFALEADLRRALALEPPILPPEPQIESQHEQLLLDIARAWLDWWDDLFLEPAGDEDAWVPDHLEYRFRVSAPDGDAQIVLTAGEYHTGDLDWFDFDVEVDAALDGEAGPGQLTTSVHAVVPTSVEFSGMPAPRWWEFEDGRVDFGRVDAAPDDLARLLLLEFALVYGNDWLMIPVTLEAGSICRVRSLRVTDTFGVQLEIPAAQRSGDTAASWGLYYPAVAGRPLTHDVDAADRLFFLPPTLASSLNSDPVEQVLFIRDEMANLAWAIERIVPGADGRPVDRFEAYQEKRRAEPPPEPIPEGASVEYRLASTIPDHWIPLVPVHTGQDRRAIALQRGAMLDPETGGAILPLGRILTPGQRLVFPEETVSRAGERVRRHFQHTRWIDGGSLLWMGRARRPGRGEGSSGLRFDSAS